MLAFLVDLRDEVLEGEALGGGDLLKPLPERIFQTDAALTSGNLDCSFDNQRGALRLLSLRHLRRSRAHESSINLSGPRPTHILFRATLLADHDRWGAEQC